MAMEKEKEHSGKRHTSGKRSDSGRMGKRITKVNVKRTRRINDKEIIKEELNRK